MGGVVGRAGLVLKSADIHNHALRAVGLAGFAHVATMQDQPVVGTVLPVRGDELHQAVFNFADGLAGGQADAVGDAEDVGVHGNRRFAKDGVEDDVGGLAAHAGEGFEGGAVVRDFACVAVKQLPTGGDDVFGLGVVQTNGGDMALQACFAEFQDSLRGVGNGKQAPGGFVDADISRLCRKNHRDQEFKWGAVFKLGRRLRVEFGQAGEQGVDVGLGQARGAAWRAGGGHRAILAQSRRARGHGPK